MRLAGLMSVLVAFAAPALADDDPQARARAHYEIGSGLYRLGDYSGAQREFAAGYELTHKTGFLLNLGQTYRKLHDLSSARDMYKKFLGDAAPDDPQRAQARQVLADLEAELRSQPAPPPSPVPEPMVTPPAASPVPSLPSVAVMARPAPAARRHARALEAAGITLGVLGLGLAGGGVGAAVLADGEARQLNTLDRNGGTFDAARDDRYHLDRALEGALLGVGAALVVTGVVLLAVGAR